jgi:hypothetical protein
MFVTATLPTTGTMDRVYNARWRLSLSKRRRLRNQETATYVLSDKVVIPYKWIWKVRAYVVLQRNLFFFLIQGLWQQCVEQVYQRHFSKSMCSLRVCVSHSGNSRNISNLFIIIIIICYGELWRSYIVGKMLSNSIACYKGIFRGGKSKPIRYTSVSSYFKKIAIATPAFSNHHPGKSATINIEASPCISK